MENRHGLGPRPNPTTRRRGEILFHDATISFETWQSCSTGHPDARADGLNWDLVNDGVGNPKNTKSMLLAHVTPPASVRHSLTYGLALRGPDLSFRRVEDDFSAQPAGCIAHDDRDALPIAHLHVGVGAAAEAATD